MSDERPKAGKYELTMQWDERLNDPIKNEPDRFDRHNPGDIVTLSASDAGRLVSIGAAVKPGARERAAAEQAKAQADALYAQAKALEAQAVLGDDDEATEENTAPPVEVTKTR